MLFRSAKLESVLIESGTVDLGERTFSITPLESFVIRCNELNIGTEALAYCINLNDVRINSESTVIGNSAFIGNTSLSAYSATSDVRSIGDLAFANCSSMKIFSFGYLSGENSMESGSVPVIVKESEFIMPTLGESIFLNTPLESIQVPDYALEDFKKALPGYADIIVAILTTSTEYIQGTTLSAYPNPTDGIVKITGLSAGKKVSLFSITGALINTYIATDDVLTINIESLAKGMYFIECEGKSVKVIKN